MGNHSGPFVSHLAVRAVAGDVVVPVPRPGVPPRVDGGGRGLVVRVVPVRGVAAVVSTGAAGKDLGNNIIYILKSFKVKNQTFSIVACIIIIFVNVGQIPCHLPARQLPLQ